MNSSFSRSSNSANEPRSIPLLSVVLWLPVLLFSAPLVAWYWPKSCGLSISPSTYTGYYRGFGLKDGTGILGRNFFRFIVNEGEEGELVVDYVRPGYNRYRGFYPNGNLRMVGEIHVNLNGLRSDPAPDVHDVRWGKYYLPDGSLGSEIIDGTGIQTYWTSENLKHWELTLENYKRKQLSMWHANGVLAVEISYKDGQQHGPYRSYHENSQLSRKVSYDDGECVGISIEYDEDGTVTRETDCDASAVGQDVSDE